MSGKGHGKDYERRNNWDQMNNVDLVLESLQRIAPVAMMKIKLWKAAISVTFEVNTEMMVESGVESMLKLCQRVLVSKKRRWRQLWWKILLVKYARCLWRREIAR